MISKKTPFALLASFSAILSLGGGVGSTTHAFREAAPPRIIIRRATSSPSSSSSNSILFPNSSRRIRGALFLPPPPPTTKTTKLDAKPRRRGGVGGFGDDAVGGGGLQASKNDGTGDLHVDAKGRRRGDAEEIAAAGSLVAARVTRPLLLSMMSAFLLPLFLFLSTLALPDAAWAVQSGGRMGGSFGGGGGGRQQQSSGRSYSGGGGGGYRGYSSGGGYYPRSNTNVIISPGINPFYNPFYSPFYSPFYARPSGVVVSTGPSFGGLFLVVGFFLVASAVLSNVGSLGGSGPAGSAAARSALGPGTSVIELSVALDVPNRDDPNSILAALDRLSRTAKTDSRVGVQNLTSQVALELLRRKSSIVAACAKGRHFGDAGGAQAQREYNGATVRERGKFQRETISRYGGVDYSSEKKKLKSSPDDYSADATVAVITIVMLIEGDSTSDAMPSRMNSVRDVESALSRIASDARVDDCLRGAEILWTPEERDETLTMREVLADYPSLRSI